MSVEPHVRVGISSNKQLMLKISQFMTTVPIYNLAIFNFLCEIPYRDFQVYLSINLSIYIYKINKSKNKKRKSLFKKLQWYTFMMSHFVF